MATLETSRPAASAAAPLFAGLSLRVWQIIGLAAVLAAACVLPFVISSYQLLLATQVIVYAVALLGLNILTGYNGQFSLGHGAFYAIGAYTTAILLDKTGIPYWATIPMAGVLCFIVGFLFGLPALRLEGHYLALATFALAIATPQLLKYKDFDFLTGGVQGIVISAPDAPDGLPLRADQWLYFFCLLWTIPLFIVAWNLLRGRTGRALVAIRDHPLAAATMGIDTARYKSMTFGVSAMYTGIAGALGALLAQFVSPDSFDFFLSVRFLVGVVVGGLASMTGAFFGAIFIEFVPNIADLLSKAAPQAIYGVVLIGCMYLMPTGVMGLVRALGHRLGRWVAR
ncbi:MAG TPA: branched-chain amino acid ABC transporter permease [Stellaceae bacterium]|jgi:branched-chain amino acid transport system permease protein|nr:branched-chain amino acid ABC transporter permease [Stellaceae bacterium]